MTTYAEQHRLVDDQMEVQLQPRKKVRAPQKKHKLLQGGAPPLMFVGLYSHQL